MYRARMTIEIDVLTLNGTALDLLVNQFARALQGESASAGDVVTLVLDKDGRVSRVDTDGLTTMFTPRRIERVGA